MNCRENQDGYAPTKDPRYASETNERAVCCIHLKSQGLTNLIAKADGTYKCKDTQPCVIKKTNPKAVAMAKTKEKKKTKKNNSKKLAPPGHKIIRAHGPLPKSTANLSTRKSAKLSPPLATRRPGAPEGQTPVTIPKRGTPSPRARLALNLTISAFANSSPSLTAWFTQCSTIGSRLP